MKLIVSVMWGDPHTLQRCTEYFGPFDNEDAAKNFVDENYGKGSIAYKHTAQYDCQMPYYIVDTITL